MNKYFKKALPIFSKEYIDKINISLLFIEDFPKYDDLTLTIAGEIEFQIFLNGKLIGYGPARGAHNYHRVDEYKLDNLKENNRLVIILASYLANTFDRVNEPAFIQYEIKNNQDIICFSNLNTKSYLYEARYQKVVRFSYQRAFSESYNDLIDNKIFNAGYGIPYKRVELIKNEYGHLIDRNVHYPTLKEKHFKLEEKDKIEIDDSLKVFDNRYMYNQGLIIFDKKEWEVDPNGIVSKLRPHKLNEIDNVISSYQSLAFSHPISLTGFIKVDVEVIEDSSLFIYFDETREDKEEIDFRFYRNATHNIVSYELKKGRYQLICFSPYTAKYIRITNLKGEAKIYDISIILLENPDSYNIKYQFENKKLNAIFDSARNTFASNAVDILTDCPSRERAGWLCDSYFTGRSEKLFTGLNLVERNFLENYAMYKYRGDVEKNMIPMCYPADFKNNEMYIPNWSLFYVVELESYLTRNKDEELIKSSLKNISKLITFFKKYENELGLLEDLENWVFVEWSPANDKESIQGVNIPSNALYSKFLIAAGHILKDESLIKKGENIKKLIKDLAFNGEFFVDNLIRNENNELIQDDRIGETTLYYLFYFDVINKDEYPTLFNKMVKDFGPNRDINKTYPNVYKSNVFIGDYLRLEILLKYRLYQEALNETVDYFYKMAKLTGTLWEHDSAFASLNHGFASFVANIIFEALTGIYKIDYLNHKIYVRKVDNNEKFSFEIPLGDNILHIKKDTHLEISNLGCYQIISKLSGNMSSTKNSKN